jgi:uncharacterized membrane protein
MPTKSAGGATGSSTIGSGAAAIVVGTGITIVEVVLVVILDVVVVEITVVGVVVVAYSTIFAGDSCGVAQATKTKRPNTTNRANATKGRFENLLIVFSLRLESQG